MRKLFPIIQSVVFLMILNSCAPAYVPNVVSAPSLKNKGDLVLGGYYGSSGFDMQAAYAFSDHWGALVNGSFDKQTTNTSDSHEHAFVEGGVGYFFSDNNWFNWSIYAGYGGGNYQSYFSNDLVTQYNMVNTNRIFIQPSFGLFSRYLEGEMGMRLSLLGVNGYRDNPHNVPERFQEFIPLFEPALTIKFGAQHLKFIFQGGMSFDLKKTDFFLYYPMIISMGIQWRFNTNKKN